MRILRWFDPWSNPWCTCPPKYTLNPYTGCGHRCRYCYITSYIRNAFNPRIKSRIVKSLMRDLYSLGYGGTVAISYSSDPYTPPEDRLGIMRPILKLFKEYRWKVLLATKSRLVLRDLDIFRDMDVVVSITITTLDESLSLRLEPNASPPRDRLETIYRLSQEGIPVSVRIDPIIPFLNDDPVAIKMLVEAVLSCGANHIVSSVYKAKPDSMRRLVDDVGIDESRFRRLYSSGFYLNGYRYAPTNYRFSILNYTRNIVKKMGGDIGFTTCREGFPRLDDVNTFCDASHLL